MNNIIVRNADGFEDRRFVFDVSSATVYVFFFWWWWWWWGGRHSVPAGGQGSVFLWACHQHSGPESGGPVRRRRTQALLLASRVGARTPRVDGRNCGGGQHAHRARRCGIRWRGGVRRRQRRRPGQCAAQPHIERGDVVRVWIAIVESLGAPVAVWPSVPWSGTTVAGRDVLKHGRALAWRERASVRACVRRRACAGTVPLDGWVAVQPSVCAAFHQQHSVEQAKQPGSEQPPVAATGTAADADHAAASRGDGGPEHAVADNAGRLGPLDHKPAGEHANGRGLPRPCGRGARTGRERAAALG